MSKDNPLNVEHHFSNGVSQRDNEPVESMLRRFKREVINSGVLTELKRREFFEKPSVLKKKAKESAMRKKARKRIVFAQE